MQKQQKNILAIDVGGTNIKVLATGQKEPVKIPSGPKMTAKKMVKEVRDATKDWNYSVVSIGYPGPVVHGRPLCNPHNLGGGWVGFDFRKAFGRPVKIVNDAAMQALGIYRGGRMLFLGLGTGLGSAMIVDGILEPMEVAHLPYKKGRTYEDYLGIRGLKRLGKKKWRRHVADIAEPTEERARSGLRGSRRRKCEAAEDIAAGMPHGRQRHCIHRVVFGFGTGRRKNQNGAGQPVRKRS